MQEPFPFRSSTSSSKLELRLSDIESLREVERCGSPVMIANDGQARQHASLTARTDSWRRSGDERWFDAFSTAHEVFHFVLQKGGKRPREAGG